MNPVSSARGMIIGLLVGLAFTTASAQTPPLAESVATAASAAAASERQVSLFAPYLVNKFASLFSGLSGSR